MQAFYAWESIGVLSMENRTANWEKFGIYIAATIAILTFVIYIADIKERIAKLEVKVEKLEEK